MLDEVSTFWTILDPFEVSIFVEPATRLPDSLHSDFEFENRSNFRSVFRCDSTNVEIPEQKQAKPGYITVLRTVQG